MWILYNKKATLYTYSRNLNNVASYSTTWTLFACAIQPVWIKDWIEWEMMFRTKKMYSDKKVNTWDKVVIDGVTYIVNNTQDRDWTKRRFCKSFIVESKGT